MDNFLNPSAGFQSQFQGAPEWVQNYLQTAGNQRNLDVSDIYSEYSPQFQQAQQQYGDAFYNPAFLQNKGMDFSSYNPFQDQGQSGQVGQFGWEWNPFSGLSGDVEGGMEYLQHFMDHGKDAWKGALDGKQGDLNFFSQYAPGHDSLWEVGKGYNYDARSQAMQGAQTDYNKLLEIQKMYGGY